MKTLTNQRRKFKPYDVLVAKWYGTAIKYNKER